MQVRKIGSSELSPTTPKPSVEQPKLARRPTLFTLDMMVPSSDAEALSQHLMLLPTPTMAKDHQGQVHRMPPPPGKPNPEVMQIEEYASLERLQSMIESAGKAVACLSRSGTSVEAKKLYKRLKTDHMARRWFLLNKNTKVVASLSTWKERQAKRPLALLVAPFTLYKQVEKLLDAYAAVFEPLKDLKKR